MARLYYSLNWRSLCFGVLSGTVSIRLRIRTRTWSVLYLEFSCWPSAGSVLFFFAKYFKLSLILEWPGRKKQATWGKPFQNFGCLLQLVKLTLIMEWPGQKKVTWGNPLQDFGSLLQLVKLIEYLKISVGEPLAKLQLFSSLGLHKESRSGNFDLVWVRVIQQFWKKSLK